jgi:uncharacterized protein YecE (DUF72 family)
LRRGLARAVHAWVGMTRLYRIGTSGWNYKHWRGRWYPQAVPVKRWFEHYAEVFDTVEINNTFYRWPKEEVFDAWREQTPPGFIYAVKANRLITHMKKLATPDEPLERLYTRARRLGKHLGPILFQFPPLWRKNVPRLREFCRTLAKNVDHVFEFRHADWLADDVFETLAEYRVSLCIHDLLPDHPRHVTGRIIYVRLHGAEGKYFGEYRRDALQRWADWIREAARGETPVYVYFNNDADAQAVRNALLLRELLG